MAGYILMIDDDWFLGDTVIGALRRRGWAVRVAGSGNAALEVVRTAPPALVLLDVGLPDGDGWYLLGRLRELVTEEVPVVVVSAQPVTRTQLRLHRVTGYVAKPFSIARLLEMIEAARPGPPAASDEPGVSSHEESPRAGDEGPHERRR